MLSWVVNLPLCPRRVARSHLAPWGGGIRPLGLWQSQGNCRKEGVAHYFNVVFAQRGSPLFAIMAIRDPCLLLGLWVFSPPQEIPLAAAWARKPCGSGRVPGTAAPSPPSPPDPHRSPISSGGDHRPSHRHCDRHPFSLFSPRFRFFCLRAGFLICFFYPEKCPQHDTTPTLTMRVRFWVRFSLVLIFVSVSPLLVVEE